MPLLVFGLALALRVWFVAVGTIEQRGDAHQYVMYAENLVRFHTFSAADPRFGPVLPDSFRDPGYPFFLAAGMTLLDSPQTWYLCVLMAQAVLGALSASLASMISARWLSRGWAAAVGVAAALWPHNVVISGYLLSETLFGSLAMLSVWLTCRAMESTVWFRWLLAGLAYSAAAMVNATITPFALLLALLLRKRGFAASRLALLMLCGSLLFPAVWAARGWPLDAAASPASRAVMNFVQGSWPGYHDAYNGWFTHDPVAEDTMRAISREQQQALQSPAAGWSAMWSRFRAEPGRYLAWYAWKPALLWAWSIRLGWGDIYPYPVTGSIYLSNPVMPAIEALCFALNPVLFVLMVPMLLAMLLRPVLSAAYPGLLVVSALVAFETLVYSVLQSEPRYSIPFRPLELLLAVSALEAMLRLYRKRRGIGSEPLSGDVASSGRQADSAESPAPRGAI